MRLFGWNWAHLGSLRQVGQHVLWVLALEEQIVLVVTLVCSVLASRSSRSCSLLGVPAGHEDRQCTSSFGVVTRHVGEGSFCEAAHLLEISPLVTLDCSESG